MTRMGTERGGLVRGHHEFRQHQPAEERERCGVAGSLFSPVAEDDPPICFNRRQVPVHAFLFLFLYTTG
jgi:hypothetical protein